MGCEEAAVLCIRNTYGDAAVVSQCYEDVFHVVDEIRIHIVSLYSLFAQRIECCDTHAAAFWASV